MYRRANLGYKKVRGRITLVLSRDCQQGDMTLASVSVPEVGQLCLTCLNLSPIPESDLTCSDWLDWLPVALGIDPSYTVEILMHFPHHTTTSFPFLFFFLLLFPVFSTILATAMIIQYLLHTNIIVTIAFYNHHYSYHNHQYVTCFTTTTTTSDNYLHHRIHLPWWLRLPW